MFIPSLTDWNIQNILLRMLVSFFLGALIGIDRGVKRRGGGARTDAAVCLGAAMVMITAQYMNLFCDGGTDISRMAAQVVSGVGFLGAGSIIVSHHQVKGLTSAAGIWICACIGLAAGIGFVDGAILATLILLGGLHLLPFLESRIYQHSRYINLYSEAEDGRATTVLLHKLKEDGCLIDMYDVERPKTAGQSFTILATVRIPAKLKRDEYLENLCGVPGIVSIDSL